MAFSSINELANLRNIMASRQENSADIIESGDFRVDLSTRQASVRGQELRLSDEEFELLVFLMGHSTGIITPQTRLTTRWGRNAIHQAEAMRVLAQLRQKLESAGCGHCLRTESWIVFRFEPRNRNEIH
jgi:DNA-binding response OmpR family regulator